VSNAKFTHGFAPKEKHNNPQYFLYFCRLITSLVFMNFFTTINLSEWQWLLVYVFLGSLAIQLCYYLFFYLRLYFVREYPQKLDLPPITVIICARNEAENLEKFLPAVLTQDYPEFQVVVVNHASTDDSETVLARLKLTHPHLYFTQIMPSTRFNHNKKLAINVGIKAAKYDNLVFTDADCYPASNQWLRKIAAPWDSDTEFVLAHGAYTPTPGLLNYLIRYDAAFIAMQYLSFAKVGIPYMGVGRNMAYRKDVFIRNRGFGAFNQMNSGDDDLMVNQMAKARTTKVVLSPESVTLSPAKTTWRSWHVQKNRHLSTAPHYKLGHILLLGLEPLSRTLYHLLVALLLLLAIPAWPIVVVGVFIRTAAFYTATTRAFVKFKEKNLLWGALVLDIFMPIIYLWLSKSENPKKRKQSQWM
jgi:glycosyltransferase involved in cell wall biosynthesis